MTKTQDLGISQLPNGNWCYRFTKTVDGKRVNRKGSKDEAGNPLKTKRAAAQAKAIAEMRFEASLNQKPEYRILCNQMGHASGKVTERYYLAVSQSGIDILVRNLNAV